MPRRAHVMGGAAAVLVLVLAGLAATRGIDWPRLVGAVWPIGLGSRPGLLLDLRLAALKDDRALCRRVLATPHVQATEVADQTAIDGCGWTNSVRVVAVAGMPFAADKLTCELTAALALWIANEVQPAAEAAFGTRVIALQHRGGYACRNIRGNPLHAHIRSEHAAANALDIYGFSLADGRRVSVAGHWAGAGAEARFLAAIHARACRYFRVAIGPAYNTAHRDHFHLDRGSRTACQ